MVKKIFLPLWGLASFFLFLYSFTQVDLSLTLSRASFIQAVQKSFQYIGWFERPLSTYLYIGIFLVLFVLYFYSLKWVRKGKLDRKMVWVSIILTSLILTFSYNALSYDLFNYIFDAKIVTFYNQNPYIHKALDFPNDPMLSFMRWTHRTYPYGPGWLLITIPLSYIGNNIFVVTFFLFKILMASFFIITAFSIEKIARLIKINNPLVPLAAFSLNPLVLVESLVSAHNDIVMMGLCMLGLYFLLDKKLMKGSFLYFFSVTVKFATALGLLIYFLLIGVKKSNQIILGSVIIMVVAVVLASLRTNFQPWYLLYVAPFAVLMYEKTYIKIPFWVFSVIAIVYYVPFLYTGNWDPPIPLFLNNMLLIACIGSIILILINKFLIASERR